MVSVFCFDLCCVSAHVVGSEAHNTVSDNLRRQEAFEYPVVLITYRLAL